MSFPVNLASSAFTLSAARNSEGEFIVNAVSTDGGSHPRNVAIQTTMALVEFGRSDAAGDGGKAVLEPRSDDGAVGQGPLHAGRGRGHYDPRPADKQGP